VSFGFGGSKESLHPVIIRGANKYVLQDVLVQGMPPACMTLATVITGQFNVGNPVPMGSDSMLFQNLSSEDMQEIQDALDAHPAKL
jgi:hypothetical protein